MDHCEIPDPIFREAVSAIDAGDVNTLESLLSAHPKLIRDRLDYGEGYFRQPYLLWFVDQATPLDWAEYLQRQEIAAYLHEKSTVIPPREP